MAIGKAKHDYDAPQFYTMIGKLASKGMSDAEIADILELSPNKFSAMKNGNYEKWSAQQNEMRGQKIRNELEVGRRRVISAVRATYISSALGKIKLKSKVLRHVEVMCEECGGEDKNCPKCGGVGRVPLSERVVVQETETECAPNMQALATILHQHDPTWMNMKEALRAENEIPTEIPRGIDVEDWIKKEVEDKEKKDAEK